MTRSNSGDSESWQLSGLPAEDHGLHVRHSGVGPPVLLLHGLAASGLYFSRAFDVLADTNRLIVPDLLGFGRSPWPPECQYELDDHIDALTTLLDDLEVQSPTWIVAHSAGVALAVELAHRFPRRVAGIVGFAPALFEDEESGRRLFSRIGWSARMFASDNFIARFVCRMMCKYRTAAAWLAERLRRDLPSQIARDGVRHTWASYSGTLRHVVLESRSLQKLSDLSLPVEFIVGDRDPVCAHLLADHPPNIPVTTWEGGHHLPVFRAEDCVAAAQRAIRKAPS